MIFTASSILKMTHKLRFSDPSSVQLSRKKKKKDVWKVIGLPMKLTEREESMILETCKNQSQRMPWKSSSAGCLWLLLPQLPLVISRIPLSACFIESFQLNPGHVPSPCLLVNRKMRTFQLRLLGIRACIIPARH